MNREHITENQDAPDTNEHDRRALGHSSHSSHSTHHSNGGGESGGNSHHSYGGGGNNPSPHRVIPAAAVYDMNHTFGGH